MFSPPIFGELGIFLVGFTVYIAKSFKNPLRLSMVKQKCTKRVCPANIYLLTGTLLV